MVVSLLDELLAVFKYLMLVSLLMGLGRWRSRGIRNELCMLIVSIFFFCGRIMLWFSCRRHPSVDTWFPCNINFCSSWLNSMKFYHNDLCYYIKSGIANGGPTRTRSETRGPKGLKMVFFNVSVPWNNFCCS